MEEPLVEAEGLDAPKVLVKWEQLLQLRNEGNNHPAKKICMEIK